MHKMYILLRYSINDYEVLKVTLHLQSTEYRSLVQFVTEDSIIMMSVSVVLMLLVRPKS